MDWLLEPFTCGTCDFMVRGLLAGLLTVVTTSLIGTWVVLRGMAFMGDAMAHGVIPGITGAYLLGINLSLGAVVSAAAMVGGITLVSRRSRLSEDTSIGLLFVGMLALGVLLISARGAYAGDLTAILFGDAVGVTASDVTATAAAAVVTLVVTYVLYRPFVALSFSEDKAEALGMRPRVAHLAMLALIGIAIVVSFQTVGTLLVFAFIIAPPAAASLVSRRVPVLMAVAVALGSVAVVVGLLLSYHLAVAGSPAIAAVAVAEFFLVLIGVEVAAKLRRGGPVPVPA
ncbi:MAG: zinc ABC transporter permease AztB [Actinomycetes bacterium]